MKDKEGHPYGTRVRLREGTLGSIVSRPREKDGKYLIHCEDRVRRAVRARDFTVVPRTGPPMFVVGPGGSMARNPEAEDG